MSKESKETVQEWLKNRSRYLEVSVSKSKLYAKSSEDSRLFPFEDTTARSMWMKAVEKTVAEKGEELEEKTRSKGT